MLNKQHVAGHWNLWLATGAAAILLALFLGYGFLSPGTYYDDDISHYLIARGSWLHPSLLWDTWGRPAFTMLYAPISLLGFGAARAFSAVIALITCLLAAQVAKSYGARAWWIAVPLTGLQPELLRQAFSVSTELTAAFLLCAALVAYKNERWTLLGLIAGFIPLARYELLPVLAVLGVILLRKRAFAGFALLAVPMATQNILNAVTQGSLLHLLFPLDYAAGVHPGQGKFDYGDSSPLHYLLASPKIFGWVTVLLMLWGAIRSRFGLLHAIIVIGFAVLAISSGSLVPKNVPVYPRYATIISPAIGILAAIGFDRLWPKVSAAAEPRTMPGTRIPLAHLAGILAALVLAAPTIAAVKPFLLSPERMAVMDTARWFQAGPYANRLVVCSHVWFPYATGLDRYDSRVYRFMNPQAVESAPPGSIIIWDRHYSPRLHFLVPLDTLQDNPRFRLLRHRTAWRNFDIYVFEKMF